MAPKPMAWAQVLFWASVPLTLAQDSTTPASGIMTVTGTSSGMPQATDSAPGSSSSSSDSGNNDSSTGTTSLVNYYFVFLALILCVAGLGVFLLFRRRRRAMAHVRSNSRENALARDLSAWHGDSTRSGGQRRYWQGRWRSTEDVDREEGLNELGEAPPAYAPPKTREEEEREAAAHQELAVPLQALSREGAGFKPPDYTETNVWPLDDPTRQPSASGASHSRDHDDSRGAPARSPGP